MEHSKSNIKAKNSIYISRRLNELKESKFLTNRIFIRISENMHYEIFKHLNNLDLLQIRALSQGGLQLTSNTHLRSRIKNYFPGIRINLNMQNNLRDNLRYIKNIFEQTGIMNLDLREIPMKGERIIDLGKIIKQLLGLQGINLSKYFN